MSSTAAAGMAQRFRSSGALRLLGGATAATSAVAFALLVAAIWADDFESEDLVRAFGCAAVLAFAGAHACLVLGARRPTDGDAIELLVAREADPSLPVRGRRRRFVDVEGEHEPAFAGAGSADAAASDPTRVDGRRVRISDLLDADLLKTEEHLIWRRPKRGEEYHATVTSKGEIRLDDGRTFATPAQRWQRRISRPTTAGTRGPYNEPTTLAPSTLFGSGSRP